MLVDKPLNELKEYHGINPKPADFDAFWDRSIAEMEALDPQVELIPSAFQLPFAECFDLYFTGTGNGSRIHAKLIRPRNPADRKGPAVVQFHGYSGNTGDWQSKMALVACGFTYAALDCRGQGGQSQDLGGNSGNTLHGQIIRGLDDAPEKMLFRNIFLDCAQLVRIVASQPGVDRTRIGVTGGSQGGGLTLAAASLLPWINRAAPAFPFLSDYRRTWEMDLAVDAYSELKEYFRLFDPRHEREDEIFTKLGYIDIHHMTNRIRGKVMMFTGLMDTICPPSTQFAAFNAIPGEKKNVLYPDFGHEYLPDCDDMIIQFMLEMLN